MACKSISEIRTKNDYMNPGYFNRYPSVLNDNFKFVALNFSGKPTISTNEFIEFLKTNGAFQFQNYWVGILGHHWVSSAFVNTETGENFNMSGSVIEVFNADTNNIFYIRVSTVKNDPDTTTFGSRCWVCYYCNTDSPYYKWKKLSDQTDINALSSRITTLENFVNQFSATDNITYGIKNRKPEEICGVGEVVLVDDEAIATTLEGDGSWQIPLPDGFNLPNLENENISDLMFDEPQIETPINEDEKGDDI